MAALLCGIDRYTTDYYIAELNNLVTKNVSRGRDSAFSFILNMFNTAYPFLYYYNCHCSNIFCKKSINRNLFLGSLN